MVDVNALMVSILTGNCTLTRRGLTDARLVDRLSPYHKKGSFWSNYMNSTQGVFDVFDIHNLIAVERGRVAANGKKALSLSFSHGNSSGGRHHVILKGSTEEHGSLVAKISWVGLSDLDPGTEHGLDPARNKAHERIDGQTLCVHHHFAVPDGPLDFRAAKTDAVAFSRNQQCEHTMRSEVASFWLQDVTALPQLVGAGCCAYKLRDDCTVQLFVSVYPQLEPFENNKTVLELGRSPRCQQMGWGPLQCHLARLNASLELFEQLHEKSACVCVSQPHMTCVCTRLPSTPGPCD